MSIASEITRLQNAKNDLKTAINAKGGTITTEHIDLYADFVDMLERGVELTQAQYDALTVKDSDTYYLING